MDKHTTIRVDRETHRLLKIMAAQRGIAMMELVKMLAERESFREKKRLNDE